MLAGSYVSLSRCLGWLLRLNALVKRFALADPLVNRLALSTRHAVYERCSALAWKCCWTFIAVCWKSKVRLFSLIINFIPRLIFAIKCLGMELKSIFSRRTVQGKKSYSSAKNRVDIVLIFGWARTVFRMWIRFFKYRVQRVWMALGKHDLIAFASAYFQSVPNTILCSM